MRAIKYLITVMVIALSPVQLGAKVLDPYEGLLPPKYVVQPSPTPMSADAIKGKVVAVIPSKRFVKHVAWMQKWFGPDKLKGLRARNPEAAKALDYALDPKYVSDKLVGSMSPFAQDVIVADDFPSARAKGADRYLIFDFENKIKTGLGDFFNPFGGAGDQVAQGGVYLLDDRLQLLSSLAAKGKVPAREASLFGGQSETYLLYADDNARAQDAFLKSILEQIDSAWGLSAARTEMAQEAQAAAALKQKEEQRLAAERTAQAAQARANADQMFAQQIAESNAAQLFLIADERAAAGDKAQARIALRQLITKFPDHALVASAANRLTQLGSGE